MKERDESVSVNSRHNDAESPTHLPPGRPRGGMRQVAREAGVSEGTVRRACKMVQRLTPAAVAFANEHRLNSAARLRAVDAGGKDDNEDRQLASLRAEGKPRPARDRAQESLDAWVRRWRYEDFAWDMLWDACMSVPPPPDPEDDE